MYPYAGGIIIVHSHITTGINLGSYKTTYPILAVSGTPPFCFFIVNVLLESMCLATVFIVNVLLESMCLATVFIVNVLLESMCLATVFIVNVLLESMCLATVFIIRLFLLSDYDVILLEENRNITEKHVFISIK